MKNISVIFILLGLLSCGREAENLKLKSNLYDPGINRGITANFDFEEIFRAGTILAIPNEDELNGVSFEAPKSWDKYFVEMKNDRGNPFFSKLPKVSFKPNTSNFEKRKIITRVILLAGEIRDDLYLQLSKLEKDISLLKLEISEKVSPYLEKYICYEPKRQGRRKLYNCLSNGSKSRVPEKCSDIDSYTFTDFTPEQNQQKEEDYIKCEEIEAPFDIKMQELIDMKTKLEGDRRFAKSMVTDMLIDIQKQNNITYLFTSIGSEDKGTANQSLLKLTDDKSSIENLELNISFGKGNEVYSSELGTIEINKFQILQTPSVLDFTIKTNDHCFSFETSGTLTKYGLRFIGDLIVKDIDCTHQIRKGVVKLELNEKSI